jgi:hypothetical protein
MRDRAWAIWVVTMLLVVGCVGDAVVSVRVENPCDVDLDLRYWHVFGDGEPDDEASTGVPVTVHANSDRTYGLMTARGSRTVLLVRIDEVRVRERFESSGNDVTHEIAITEEMCPGVGS